MAFYPSSHAPSIPRCDASDAATGLPPFFDPGQGWRKISTLAEGVEERRRDISSEFLVDTFSPFDLRNVTR